MLKGKEKQCEGAKETLKPDSDRTDFGYQPGNLK